MPDAALALRRQPRDSLATKIILFVFFATFLTAVVVSWIALHSTYTFLRQQLASTRPLLAERSAARLDALLDEAFEELDALARALPRAARGRNGSASPVPELDAHRETSSLFAALWVVDGRGRLQATSGEPGFLPADPIPELAGPDGPGLRFVDGGEFAGPVVSVPLAGVGGRAASLHGLLAPDTLGLQLASELLSEGGDVYLVDAGGRPLAAGRRRVRAGEPALPLEPAQPAAASLRTARGPDNGRVFVVARALERAGWAVVVYEPVREAYAPIFSALARILVINLGVVLLFTLLAYEITGAILRPLEALYRAARRVSRGDLDVEVPVVNAQDELGLLTRTFNNMTQRLAKNRGELEGAYGRQREQNEELQRANEILAQLSITDGLTKLHNHRYFQDHLTREIKRVQRTGEPLSMLLLDIDDFKALNDRLGHAAGDEILVRIAQILNDSVRESDLLARYGGEEFVVLAIGTVSEGAMRLAEKIRAAVEDASLILDDSLRPFRVTVSIGVATFRGDRKEFFQRADRALYRAKEHGKNCVVVDGLEP